MVRFVALLGILILGSIGIHAQNTCDDPPFENNRTWDLTDFCQYQEGVYDEIISGGVGRDGIPPIDDPQFESIEEAAEWLQPQSPVIAFELNGDARAYPLAILTRHEIVNDVVGGEPVAVTFCPLCNSAIVFERTVDGDVLRFGVSGLLRNSDLIMWDDKTQSWWQQLTGEGIVGAYTDTQLNIQGSNVVSFEAFMEQYPDGQVLDPGSRRYGDNPYRGYDSNETPFLFRGEPDPRLFPVERVLAVRIGDVAKAYPFSVLEELGVINDTINEQELVAFWQPGATSALDAADIDSSRDVGMAALYERVVEEQTLTFIIDEEGNIRDEQTNSIWNIFGTAIDGELAGTQLRQIIAAPHFWFAWAAFHPETEVYSLD
ncbi:MAG: DUF3179 domain-containing protein [Chloroflexi bacterium]|nr:MAG: DUF3179 domain-containing protein [Chloroflexota bacterium]